MSTLRQRASEPQFGSILGGFVFLAMSIGLFVVALHVHAGAARIHESTGVVFWPKNPDVRLKWDVMFGNPRVALLAGCVVGFLLGLWTRYCLKRRKGSWIHESVLAAKGVRIKTGVREITEIILTMIGLLAPWFISRVYFGFPLAGIIYANTAIAVSMFVSYPLIRSLRNEVNENLRNEPLTAAEANHVVQWQTREKKSLRSGYGWVAFYAVAIVIGTAFFARYVDRVL